MKDNNFKQIPKGWKFTDIGLIPEEWDINKLSETSEIIMGQSPPSSTYNSGGLGLPFYQGKTDFGNVYPTPRIWCASPSKISEKNDILISVRAPVGPTNLSFEKSGIGRGLSAIRARENYFLYLYYYLKKIEKEIEKLGTGSTFKAINKSQLYNIKIPLPPLPEQKIIAHILSKIQQAIETQEQIIKTSQELKKALMQKLFTEGLNGEPQKQTEIGPIPESWDVVALGSYAKILNGCAFKSQDYIKKGVPLIRISNVSFGYLISKDDKYLPVSYLERYSDFSLNEGDLILSLTRPVTSGGMKYCFIEKKHLPSLLNQRVGRFKIIDEGLSKKYLYHLVFSKYFIGELEKLFGSSSQQPNVSPSQLESFKVPLPPIQEQIEISQTLNSINSKIEHSKQIVEILKSLFTSSLNKLMTGQIRVSDIEFELEGIEKTAEAVKVS